uniref:Uncharacterized protein n=1 Tax=Strongyloides stercoralis TaxID=6248 RepID=A0A0K0DUD1_STRER
MISYFEVILILLSIKYFSLGEETSKYNYRYLYAYPEEGKEKTGSFHISLTSNGNKNEWRTVINDDGNIGILKKIPTLKSVFQKDDYKNKFNIINNKNVRKKYSTNYRKAPIVYEWTSPPNFQENLFNNFLLSDNNHKTNTPFSSLQTLENKKEENSSDKTLMNPSSNQKVEQFLHSPEFFNSNFNQKIDFSIPWFGARFYEKHQPILNSIYPSDFVKQHAINAYGNGKHLFDEMQDKLNNLFKDLNF